VEFPRSRHRVSRVLDRRSFRCVAIALACWSSLMLPGCLDVHSWTEKEKPWTEATIARSDQVRIERADGSQETLVHARIEQGERGAALVGHDSGPSGRDVRVALSEIRTLEIPEVDAGKVAANIAAALVVLAAIYLLVTQPFVPSG